jgi:hypothetical protein
MPRPQKLEKTCPKCKGKGKSVEDRGDMVARYYKKGSSVRTLFYHPMCLPAGESPVEEPPKKRPMVVAPTPKLLLNELEPRYGIGCRKEVPVHYNWTRASRAAGYPSVTHRGTRHVAITADGCVGVFDPEQVESSFPTTRAQNVSRIPLPAEVLALLGGDLRAFLMHSMEVSNTHLHPVRLANRRVFSRQGGHQTVGRPPKQARYTIVPWVMCPHRYNGTLPQMPRWLPELSINERRRRTEVHREDQFFREIIVTCFMHDSYPTICRGCTDCLPTQEPPKPPVVLVERCAAAVEANHDLEEAVRAARRALADAALQLVRAQLYGSCTTEQRALQEMQNEWARIYTLVE